MKWFKRMVIKWVREDWDNARQDCAEPSRVVSSTQCASIDSEPVLNFKVYSAIGGKVVEFRRYDRKSDRNEGTTYIITNDQDFGERIAKIATMENIKA
jgi:hypothetical protein